MRIFLNVALPGVAGSGCLIGYPSAGAPEVDPGSAASALLLLAKTLAIVRGDRKRSTPRT
jgi:hypothetical protein